jgi:hypothetical protein
MNLIIFWCLQTFRDNGRARDRVVREMERELSKNKTIKGEIKL